VLALSWPFLVRETCARAFAPGETGDVCRQMGKSGKGRRRRGAEGGDGSRVFRLQELIREEMNLLLRSEARDERLSDARITMVELAGDGSCARLWVAGPNEEVLEALEGAAGFLRTKLAEGLGLKRTPELRFRRDIATRAFDFAARETG
jgi:ribosome-binding factor A